MLDTKRLIYMINIVRLYNYKIKMIPVRQEERFSLMKPNNHAYRNLGYKSKINNLYYIKKSV